jgi:hypothetical protein
MKTFAFIKLAVSFPQRLSLGSILNYVVKVNLNDSVKAGASSSLKLCSCSYQQCELRLLTIPSITKSAP